MASSFQFLLSMGKVGPVVCVGFFLGVICACILVGGGKLLLLLFFFFLSVGQVSVRWLVLVFLLVYCLLMIMFMFLFFLLFG